MRIDLAGYGPGGADLATQKVVKILGEADLVITSERLAETLWGSGPYWEVLRDEDRYCLRAGVRFLVETDSSKICRILEETDRRQVVCLFGGDSSFYSGAAPLLKRIEASRILREKKVRVRMLPGISSLSYACARLGISFREIEAFSAHGRECDPVRCVMNGKKSFFLTGTGSGPSQLCARLKEAGLGDLEVTVCEMLSTPSERIQTMTAGEAAEQTFSPLSVLVAEPAPVSDDLRRSVPGILDDAFVRGRVPMTKRLVRVSALSLLDPKKEDLCWDLGAGTGSVSIELSARCRKVVSVEKNPEAVSLMEENRKKFGAWNMEIVKGEIPDVLSLLPEADRIFVGGGGKCIREILNHVDRRRKEALENGSEDEAGRNTVRHAERRKDPVPGRRPVVCAAAVTLETLQEVRCALEEFGYLTQVVQIAVTDVVERGHFHMMDAQNPVFLIRGE